MKLLGEGEVLEYTGGVDVKGKGRMDTYVWTPPAMTFPRLLSGPAHPDSPLPVSPSELGVVQHVPSYSRPSLCSMKGAGMQQMLTRTTSKRRMGLPPKGLQSSSSKKQMDISQIVTHVLAKIKTQGKPKPLSAP